MGMGRDTWRFKQLDREREERKQIHPIWRGVGCLLSVLLGLGGFLFARWFLEQNFIYIPPQIRVLSFAPWLPKDAIVLGVVTLMAMLIGYGVINTIYAILFPIKPTDTDVEPVRTRRKKKRR